MRKEIKLIGREGYTIDEMGNVYNPKGEILKKEITQKGYSRVNIYQGNHKRKKFYIHKLVYATFNNINNLDFKLNWINNNKSDNSLKNLQRI